MNSLANQYSLLLIGVVLYSIPVTTCADTKSKYETVDGVDWCYTNGIMTGSGSAHKLNHNSTATRAEMAKMITVVVRDVMA